MVQRKKSKSKASIVERDDKHQPTWKHQTTIKITRMDNTLAMTELVGTIKQGKKVAEVLTAIGGLGIIILHIRQPRQETRRYAISVQDALKEVFELDKKFRKPEKISLRRNRRFDDIPVK